VGTVSYLNAAQSVVGSPAREVRVRPWLPPEATAPSKGCSRGRYSPDRSFGQWGPESLCYYWQGL